MKADAFLRNTLLGVIRAYQERMSFDHSSGCSYLSSWAFPMASQTSRTILHNGLSFGAAELDWFVGSS